MKLLSRPFGQVGDVIPGLMLYGKPAPYPVVNERAVRAGAGITMLLGLFAMTSAWYTEDYQPLMIVLPLIWSDFLLKLTLGVKASPLSRLAAWIVHRQTPEYVGAIQKRFAWSIGFALASIMMMLVFVLGVVGVPNLIICGVCLTFMFFESAFGICVGCIVYNWLLAHGYIAQPDSKPVCPGNVCAIE